MQLAVGEMRALIHQSFPTAGVLSYPPPSPILSPPLVTFPTFFHYQSQVNRTIFLYGASTIAAAAAITGLAHHICTRLNVLFMLAGCTAQQMEPAAAVPQAHVLVRYIARASSFHID
jgi:hypothetical protein